MARKTSNNEDSKKDEFVPHANLKVESTNLFEKQEDNGSGSIDYPVSTIEAQTDIEGIIEGDLDTLFEDEKEETKNVGPLKKRPRMMEVPYPTGCQTDLFK